MLKQLDMYTVIHHLFVRGHPDLSLPYKRLNFSVKEYVQWMDSTSELEWINSIKSMLGYYVEEANRRGQKEYHVVYPAMLRYLKTIGEA